MRQFEIKVRVRARNVYAEDLQALERAIFRNPAHFFDIQIIDNSSILFKDAKNLDFFENPFFE